jgi:hypothetical protein
MKNLRIIPLALISYALLLPQLAASTEEDIVVDSAPPAPRIEHQPAHRDGYVWSPGFWEWTGATFRWTAGTWISERRGHWVADHWYQMDTHWHFVKGHWER